MLENFRRERQVRHALKAVARQRVAMVLQPGGVPVIEKSTPEEEWFKASVLTCQIRGWVEVLHESMPTGKIRFDGNGPRIPTETQSKTHYRLTEGGWAVLNRSHAWVVATFLVSSVGLVVAVASLAISWIAVAQTSGVASQEPVKASRAFEAVAVSKPPPAPQPQH